MALRRMLLALGAVTATMVLGTVGYWLIGGGRWPLLDCLYMTVIGLTTAGFGEVLPLHEVPAGRPFTIVLLLLGMVSVGWFVASTAALLIEGEFTGLAWRRRMHKLLAQLENHVVVCGAGSTGIHCIRELAAIGAPFAVVEAREAVAQEVSRQYRCAVVVGDATHDDALQEAGIERARGCIAALTEDKDNLFVAITARSLAPRLRIVAKAIDAKTEPKLLRAGADSVVSPNMIGGLRMVAEMVRPEVVSFLDVMTRDKDRTLRIEEVPVPGGSRLAGRRVSELALERHRLLLLAVRLPGEGRRYVYAPDPAHEVAAGDTLIVLGEPERVRQLSAEVAAR